MDWIWVVLSILGAYLLGSIPTAVWLGKLLFSTDVREHGSGNAGATNTIRVLGYKAGLPVLLIDVLKGFTAVKLACIVPGLTAGSENLIRFQLILGTLAVLGHIFPVFAGFRGGKGVATMTGILFAINPLITLICTGVFFTSLIISKYVSLSSILAGISYPIMVIFVFRIPVPSMVIFSIILAITLVLTHQKNIGRLIRKEESKADFLKIKKKR